MSVVTALQFSINVATLVNESAHDIARNWLRAVLNVRVIEIVAREAARTVLKNSPNVSTAQKLAASRQVYTKLTVAIEI